MTRTTVPACEELLDSVGQSIFGVGLLLEDCLHSTEDAAMKARLDASIRGLHAIISRIRERDVLHSPSVCGE